MPNPVISDSETNGPIEVQFPSKTLKYLQRPPTIVPNYGRKKHSLLPKSNISRVLLYDNVMQQQMLDVKLNSIKLEKQRAGKILDLHRKSFVLRQSHKQNVLPEMLAPPTLPKVPTRHCSESSSRSVKKWTGKQSRGFPTDSAGRRKDESQTAQKVPLRLEQNTEIQTVEKASTNEALSDSNGLNLPRIEGTQSRGITTKLIVQTNAGECEELDLVDSVQGAESGELNHGTSETNQINNNMVAQNGTKSATMSSKKSIDPRFLSLQNTLQQVDHHTEGFAELSPSFTRKYIKIPDYLISM
ncbi:uncharacterized protein LOC135469123 [Liolophura sinensis]|uniref:uncharacterized protein LOC135469123 n=1 Tax=Liolophura sinensis TaxID=3198878 RepID=UPI0031588B0C